MNANVLFSPRRMRVGQGLHVCPGRLDLWVRRESGEWLLAARPRAATTPFQFTGNARELTGNPDWERWATPEEAGEITFSPILPAAPLLCRPLAPLHLLPGQTATLYLELPLCLQVRLTTPDIILREWELVQLSKTWIGLPEQGEAGLAVKTPAVRRIQDLPLSLDTAVCPLEIRNDATTILEVRRMTVRGENLRVYAGATRLWTNRCRIVVRGEDEPDRVVFARTYPDLEPGGTLLGEARQPTTRGRVSRALRSIADYVG